MRLYWLIFLILIQVTICDLVAQDEDVYLDMSLTELLEVEVVQTASKKPEDLFEAPLSVTIITKAQILASGANSIPEALRLAPGLIVREQTPGNFDVHIRGFDDVTTSFILPTPTNSIILVMIDYRIAYNYFAGGTFWETLPIGINDIERIEVVRGPASALYGPNAAAGVINIITSHPERTGLNAYFNSSIGTAHNRFVNGSIGYHWSDKAALFFTGNYSYRHRFDEVYFDWKTQRYVPVDSINTLMFLGFNPETGAPFHLYELQEDMGFEVDRALRQYGLNLFFDYHFSPESRLNIATGRQQSINQKAYYNNFSTPLSEYDSESCYFDIRTKLKNLYGHISYQIGDHETNFFWNEYDFTTFDAILEYDWTFRKFSLRPGLNYRRAAYSGMLISDKIDIEKPDFSIPLETRIISANAFSLLADYRPFNQLRLISGFRLDHYNINPQLSATYEIGATYRLNKNNLVRLVVSQANRAPFIIDSYIGKGVSLGVWLDEIPGLGMVKFAPNTTADYLRINNIELGWRKYLSSQFKLEMEGFISQLSDFVDLGVNNVALDLFNYEYPVFILNLKYDNNEFIVSRLSGLSFQLEYKWNDRFNSRFYGTVQHTDLDFDFEEMKNLIREKYGVWSGGFSESELDSLTEVERENASVVSTPTFYGGFWLNFTPISRLNLNVNLYYTTKQTFQGVGIEENFSESIAASLVLNSKIEYQLGNDLSCYFSARNLLGRHREYAFTDHIDRIFLLGFQLNR